MMLLLMCVAMGSTVEERMGVLDSVRLAGPRVVVLEWQDTDVDASHPGVQKVVAKRTARPFAIYVEPYDLAQDLRFVRPTVTVEEAQRLVSESTMIPGPALSPEDWLVRLGALEAGLEGLGPVVDLPTRAVAVRLHAEAARAEIHAGVEIDTEVGGQTVSQHLWEVARLTHGTPDTPRYADELSVPLDKLAADIDAGVFGTSILDFSRRGAFDPERFARTHVVLVDGLERVITSIEGELEVLPGAPDIVLSREHGPSMAVHVDAWDGRSMVMDDADAVGRELLKSVMKRPMECDPGVSAELVSSLEAYASTGVDTQLFVAVPVAGKVKKTLIWEFLRDERRLRRVFEANDCP